MDQTSFIQPHIDIGQLIISGSIGIIGWFVKRELEKISKRLDGHDNQILGLVRSVSTLIGAFNIRTGLKDRRNEFIDSIETHD